MARGLKSAKTQGMTHAHWIHVVGAGEQYRRQCQAERNGSRESKMIQQTQGLSCRADADCD